MKTKLYMVLVSAAFMLGATSCSDFLVEDNRVGETADITYKTETGLEGLVGSCYSFARGWYGKEGALGLSEMGTDLFYTGYDNKQKSLCQYNLTSVAMDDNTSDNPCLDQYWEMFYCATDVCNNAIKYLNESDGVLSDNVKNRHLGEAYFLRALYYFNMVNIWGAIPYNDAPVTAQNMNPVRTPENEVYGKVLADLDESINYFTTAGYYTKADGRANYWAARSLKARVLLYAASWLNGQKNEQVAGNDNYSSMNGTALYNAAATEADAVINSNYASLYSNYSDMWSMNNEAYYNNSEALFGITYSEDLTTNVNCIPYRYKLDTDGNPLSYNSLITRKGYSRGGSAMLLMFVSKWNNGCNDLGGNGSKVSNVFLRVTQTASTIKSATTGNSVDVASAYSPYGRGFCRYLPSLRLWQLLESRKATDQRTEATLLDHYDIASPELAGNAKNYPNLKDTAIYYSPLDGNSDAGKAQQAYAKDKYRIQFASGGDIPVYTSSDPATALPTATAKSVSDVYGDNRYNSVAIGGWESYPGIKKFLDNVYNSSYPTNDISYRDAIVMRLPELYLIKAEAQMMTGNNAGAVETLNILRSKRAISGKDNNFYGTLTIDDLLDERAVEFCGEQMRWFDLKRTGKLYDYILKYNAQASPVIKSDLASKHFLYRPIPQTELDAVQNYTDSIGEADKFWQNPGY